MRILLLEVHNICQNILAVKLLPVGFVNIIRNLFLAMEQEYHSTLTTIFLQTSHEKHFVELVSITAFGAVVIMSNLFLAIK